MSLKTGLQRLRRGSVRWLPLFALGCGATRHVGYETANIAREPGPSIDAALQVGIFEDQRKAGGPPLVFTAKENPVTVDGKPVCINLESEYSGTIPMDVRSVVERHFRQRGVIGGSSDDRRQYVLEASLKSLYVQQALPSYPVGVVAGAVVSSVAGVPLVGAAGLALDVATRENAGRVEIVFGELRLTRIRDGATRRLPDVRLSSEAGLSGTDCENVYDHVDVKLKVAVEALAIAVERELRAWPDRQP